MRRHHREPGVDRLHREEPVDVIDAHYVYPDGEAAMLHAQRLGVPFVVSARGTDINLYPEIPAVRLRIVEVLRRDGYACTLCGWNQKEWDRSDPRHLEAHHEIRHVDKGPNTPENLVTLCTVCHDEVHRGD